MVGLFARWGSRLGRSAAQLEADEVLESTKNTGAVRLADLRDRQQVSVCGTVRALTMPPAGQVPALVAELYDGTGTVTLIWLGRREIRGIAPGTYLRAHGRVANRRGVLTIFNPMYEIMPAYGH
ncbi:MAG: OB-fold nucleic acid binding domain-containing protein [Austwickia sp.]|jgi:RecG-like helicase|nr:OB-fold nucleic acid binding domain-containing protein [Austwickia sp.]MBK8435541.1 OB-fold nucleic acid binding domain-containing protein [Austwickia sp.]MBK9100887.1 OB-fold nucleic acid binding domain-containing protein [Austwickia sp.]